MSLNIGDNFQYLGKKFLDARQSFTTLADMKSCTDVPDGFITYCVETDTRYEYKSTNANNVTTGHWRELEFPSGEYEGGGTSAVIQNEEPEDTSVIWFDPEEDDETPTEDPYVSELKAIIEAMSKQLQALTTRVEYLENVVASGGVIPDVPDIPDIPDTPDTSNILLLEDGTALLWEDGTPILLEESSESAVSDVILLEDGTPILLEDGGYLFLETAEDAEIQNALLTENGDPLLLENGGPILLER